MTPTRVVVVGAGPAGLLAARALAAHADEVVVLDRDRLAQDPAPRDGVPQDRHWNSLDRSAVAALEELLPGLVLDAVAAGGRRELGGIVIRRPELETLVRRRVAALPGVRLRDRTSALDLACDRGPRRVSGVVVTDLDRDETTHLAADLVIDASGQHTRSPAWLARRGIAVSESRTRINATFVTREFARHSTACEPVVARHVVPDPRTDVGWERAAVLASLGDRWLVTLAGSHGRRPPTDLPGFTAYAVEVCPTLGDLLHARDVVGDAAVHRFPATVTRTASGSLGGLVVTGDAWRTPDPLSERGITSAARTAVLLAELAAATPVGDLGAAWLERTRPKA